MLLLQLPHHSGKADKSIVNLCSPYLTRLCLNTMVLHALTYTQLRFVTMASLTEQSINVCVVVLLHFLLQQHYALDIKYNKTALNQLNSLPQKNSSTVLVCILKTRQQALIFPRRSSSTPGGAMVSSVAACCIWPMVHALLCIVNGDDSAVFRFFVPGDLDL